MMGTREIIKSFVLIASGTTKGNEGRIYMNIYTYLIKGYKTMTWITVNANNEDDAQIKAVNVFNDCLDDVALRVYEP